MKNQEVISIIDEILTQYDAEKGFFRGLAGWFGHSAQDSDEMKELRAIRGLLVPRGVDDEVFGQHMSALNTLVAKKDFQGSLSLKLLVYLDMKLSIQSSFSRWQNSMEHSAEEIMRELASHIEHIVLPQNIDIPAINVASLITPAMADAFLPTPHVSVFQERLSFFQGQPGSYQPFFSSAPTPSSGASDESKFAAPAA